MGGLFAEDSVSEEVAVLNPEDHAPDAEFAVEGQDGQDL